MLVHAALAEPRRLGVSRARWRRAVRYLASLPPYAMGLAPRPLRVALTEAAGRSADRREPGRAGKRSPAAGA
jgi:hypothetical protein